MANRLTTNPWELDTVSATPFWTGHIKIRALCFDSYLLDTDTATLKDKNGNTIVVFNGASDLAPIWLHDIGWVQGLALTILDSGRVRVFFE